jgi:hypothetical protein
MKPVITPLCILVCLLSCSVFASGQSNAHYSVDDYDREIASQGAQLNKIKVDIEASIKSQTWEGINKTSPIFVQRRENKTLDELSDLYRPILTQSNFVLNGIKHDESFSSILVNELKAQGYQISPNLDGTEYLITFSEYDLFRSYVSPTTVHFFDKLKADKVINISLYKWSEKGELPYLWYAYSLGDLKHYKRNPDKYIGAIVSKLGQRFDKSISIKLQ